MKVKVCGITSYDQLKQMQELQVDFAGIIFYKGSKRYADQKLVNQQAEIKKLQIRKVGVFVNAGIEEIREQIIRYRLSMIQLHGDEPMELCLALQQEVEVIKAIRINEEQERTQLLLDKYEKACDYFLLDTDTASYGGSGKQFNWDLFNRIRIEKPFFLSGGIGLKDAPRISALVHPMLHAVDINSRFETEPGVKDVEKVSEFLNQIR